MAYNLQPLITLLQQILDPEQKRWILEDKKPELESLLDKTASLQQILEKSPFTKIENSLESQIRDATHKAEDEIESYMVDRMLSIPGSATFNFSELNLCQVTLQIDSVAEEVVELIKGKAGSSSSNSSSLTPDAQMKFVHKKLQTIRFMKITPSVIRSGFFETIPNIIKLGIFYIDPPCLEVDLSHLLKLEVLACQSELDEEGSRFLPKLRLPCNLRKLNLVGCVIYGSFLTTLCALPSLEALKIWDCVFENEEADEEEWEVIDEFHSLQLLHLSGLNIARWRADETNFPRLRHLLIDKCHKLEEIPSAIGDIPTLQLIDIWKCSASVVASAQEIQKVQQEEYDNYDLKVETD